MALPSFAQFKSNLFEREVPETKGLPSFADFKLEKIGVPVEKKPEIKKEIPTLGIRPFGVGMRTTTPAIIEKEPIMRFEVGEGLTPYGREVAESKLQELAKTAPGIPVKIPFVPKEITIPEKGIEPLVVPMIEWPEELAIRMPIKVKRAFEEIVGAKPSAEAIKPKPGSPLWKMGIYEITPYSKQVLDLQEQGWDPISAALYTVSGAIFDVAVVGQILTAGAKGVLKATEKSIGKKLAWDILGRPATIESAKKEYLNLAKIFHPDKPTGNEAMFKNISNAWKVIEEEGMPNTAERSLVPKLRQISKTAISDITKKIPEEVEPYPAIKGLLPGYAEVPGQPTFAPGLTIKKMMPVGRPPAKGIIPQELQPLAQEARKYKSAEEFHSQGLRKLMGEGRVEEVQIFMKRRNDFVQKNLPKEIEKEFQVFKQKRYPVTGENLKRLTSKDKQIIDTKLREIFDKNELPRFEKEIVNRLDNQALTDFYTQAVKGIKEVELEMLIKKPPVKAVGKTILDQEITIPSGKESPIISPISRTSIKTNLEAGMAEPSLISRNIQLAPVKSTQNVLSSQRTKFLNDFSITLKGLKSSSNSIIGDYLSVVKSNESTFVRTTENIASAFDGQYTYRIKTPKSLMIKMMRRTDNNPNFTLGEIGDSLGSTVLVQDSQIPEVIEFSKRYIKDGKVDDFRSKPTFLGYRAVHLDYELENGLFTEIQINTRGGLDKKTYAHKKIYEKWRKYIESAQGDTLESIEAKIPSKMKADFRKDVKFSNDIYEGKVSIPKKYIEKNNKLIKTPKRVLEVSVKTPKPDILKEIGKPKTLEGIITAEAKALQDMESGRRGGIVIGRGEGSFRTTEHSPAYSEFYKKHGYGPKSLANWQGIAKSELEAGRSAIGLENEFRAIKGAIKEPVEAEIDVEAMFAEIEEKAMAEVPMERLVRGALVTQAEKREFLKSLSEDIKAKMEKGRGLTPAEAGRVGKIYEDFIVMGRFVDRLISMPESQLLKFKLRAEARGARAAAKSVRVMTRQELIAKFKDSQTKISEIRERMMDKIKEDLPEELRGKFIQAFTQNITRRRAYSLFERIERIKEWSARKELIAELKEVPRGEIAVDYQKKIETITEGIDWARPTQRTFEKLRGLKEYIQREGVPLGIAPETLENLERLSKMNITDMSTRELTDLKNTVNTLRQLGKLKLQLKNKYDQRQREVALKRLLESTNNLDPVTKPVSGKLSRTDTWKVHGRKAYMESVHTPRVADMIDGYKFYEGENAKYIKALGDKETSAKLESRNLTIQTLEKIIKETGIKELTPDQQVRIMIHIRYREGAYDQVKTLMESAKITELPEITEEETKLINIIKETTNKHTDEVAAISEEIENKPFRRLEEYVLPIKYEKEFNIIPSQTIEQGRYRIAQTFKGFIYERQKGVDKMPRTDIFGILEEAVNEQQWYIKMQPELENIRYLVKSEEYIEKAGELAGNFWKDVLDVVARRGWSATAQSNPILRNARIDIQKAILGYKLTSILMQPFAIFDAMSYVTTRFGGTSALEILKEFTKAWINPKYAKAIIEESPALQMRKAGEVAVEELAPGLVEKPIEGIARFLPKPIRIILRKFEKEGLTLLQSADIKTAAGVQEGIENILIKNGTLNAKKEAEFLMNLVQGSAEVSYRPLILSKGEISRTLFTFQTFFLNRWGIIAHDLIVSGLLKGPWKRKFGAFLGLAILVGGALAEDEARRSVSQLITGKKWKRASRWLVALSALPENIPILGNLIEGAINYGEADFDFPLARVLENMIGGVKVITAKKPEAKIRAGLRAGEAVATLRFGQPGTAQFFDILERIILGGEEEKKETPRKGGESMEKILKDLGLPVLPGATAPLPKLPELPALPGLPAFR